MDARTILAGGSPVLFDPNHLRGDCSMLGAVVCCCLYLELLFVFRCYCCVVSALVAMVAVLVMHISPCLIFVQ